MNISHRFLLNTESRREKENTSVCSRILSNLWISPLRMKTAKENGKKGKSGVKGFNIMVSYFTIQHFDRFSFL